MLRPSCAAVLLLPFLAACGPRPGGAPPPVERDLAAIREDTLRAVLLPNSTSYFLYRGLPMGYEYEMLQAMGEDLGLPVKMFVAEHPDDLLRILNAGEADVVAARLLAGGPLEDEVAYTVPLHTTAMTLVQREAPPAEAPTAPARRALRIERGGEALPETLRVRPVQQVRDLAGREVTTQPRSAYYDRLVELSDSLTGEIEIAEVDPITNVEALIRAVAAGEVRLTVAEEDLAELSAARFTNLTVRPIVESEQALVWGVRRNAPALLDTVNAWLESFTGSAAHRTLYAKYYTDRQRYHERVESEYLTSETGKLSDYDALLKAGAREVGWDWRLLAAQCYQESRFEPVARSWAGAQGLLQLMPPTAREFGVTNANDPEQNVQGAARFINWLQDYWADKIPDPEERRKFVLASYNTGHGHVEDARRLTEKHGGDTTVWEDVAFWLLQKSKRSVYTDPVVKYGYARGLEPVTYVARILDRYDHYRQFVEGGEAALPATGANALPDDEA